MSLDKQLLLFLHMTPHRTQVAIPPRDTIVYRIIKKQPKRSKTTMNADGKFFTSFTGFVQRPVTMLAFVAFSQRGRKTSLHATASFTDRHDVMEWRSTFVSSHFISASK